MSCFDLQLAIDVAKFPGSKQATLRDKLISSTSLGTYGKMCWKREKYENHLVDPKIKFEFQTTGILKLT